MVGYNRLVGVGYLFDLFWLILLLVAVYGVLVDSVVGYL